MGPPLPPSFEFDSKSCELRGAWVRLREGSGSLYKCVVEGTGSPLGRDRPSLPPSQVTALRSSCKRPGPPASRFGRQEGILSRNRVCSRREGGRGVDPPTLVTSPPSFLP